MRTRLLTKKEQSKLVAFREHIIARATQTEPIDHAKAEAAYNKLGELFGIPKTTKFYWFKSPYELHLKLWGQLGDQLWDQLDQAELQYWMWMEYASELDGIDVDKEKYEKLKALAELGEHSFWIMPFKDGVAFCERPIRLVRNGAGLMHYDHDAA